jgi:hypothetical protein
MRDTFNPVVPSLTNSIAANPLSDRRPVYFPFNLYHTTVTGTARARRNQSPAELLSVTSMTISGEAFAKRPALHGILQHCRLTATNAL